MRMATTGAKPITTAQKPNADTTMKSRAVSRRADCVLKLMDSPQSFLVLVGNPYASRLKAAAALGSQIERSSSSRVNQTKLRPRCAPSRDLAVEPARDVRADLHDRRSNFCGGDQAGLRQPVLCGRRARLGEQKPRQVGDLLPAGGRSVALAAPQQRLHARKTVGRDMGRKQDRAIRTIGQRVEI